MSMLHELSDDAWRQAMRSPGLVQKIRMSDDVLKRLRKKSSDDMIDIVTTIASKNDLNALQKIMDIAPELRAKDFIKGDRARLCYATAHMLYDGSGNEEFARAWMKAMGHGPSLVVDYLKRELESLSKLSEVDILSKKPVDVQRLLGASTLVDDIFKDVDKGLNLFLLAVKTDKDISAGAKRRLFLNRLVSELLHIHSPDELPTLKCRPDDFFGLVHHEKPISASALDGTVHTNLSTAIWQNNWGCLGLLPAIEMAYGNEHPRVRLEMQEAIKRVVGDQKFKIDKDRTGLDRWDAVRTWGNEEVAQALFNAVVVQSTDESCEMNKSNSARKMSFTDACRKLPDSAFTKIAHVLEALGFDTSTVSQDSPSSRGCRLLDIAAQNYNADVFTRLVAIGDDPAQCSQKGLMSPAARVRLAMKKTTSLTESALRNVTRMDDVLKALNARNAAEMVLKELDLGMSP